MSGDIKRIRAPAPLPSTELCTKCPCCNGSTKNSYLLPCLHCICKPCIRRIDLFLRKLRSKETRNGENLLGWFLCPVCHSSYPVSRFGFGNFQCGSTSFPGSPSFQTSSLSSTSSSPRSLSSPSSPSSSSSCICPVHHIPTTQYCHNCSVSVCGACLKTKHMDHFIQDLNAMSAHLYQTLRGAMLEIRDRVNHIDGSIEQIRAARKSEWSGKKKSRKEVSSFYEDRQKDPDFERRENLLLREEIELEQYKIDLELLCSQIKFILEERKGNEIARLMIPLAKRLEALSEKLFATGSALTNRLEFVPKTLTDTNGVSGSASACTISSSTSHADISSTLYEKVLCSIPLILADENGMRLYVDKDPDILCNLLVFPTVGVTHEVDVKLSRRNGSDWLLRFTPPCHGIALLTVKLHGEHVKNSPYTLTIQQLSLDIATV
ncbi:tripartite motif-containing protein 3 isoform X2 [Eurytemora carolleeae]|uniref:tripartite motif-containing protein 3 isoform X2 n=1 Tax=Eurytemora carolleeae TaxID=1294199 RepID=UPI000C7724ED|nr:tripartite motif-containing protein 3 isoform X2 [Eurytemora carolleeae]|eukprot:XP_023339096.1 tripartite motif-containing protein 3-like isoform X2 [Eurytemora affinis]